MQIIYDPDPKQTVVEEDEALLDYWFGVDVVRAGIVVVGLCCVLGMVDRSM